MRLRNRHLACTLLLFSSLSVTLSQTPPSPPTPFFYATPGIHVTVLENTLIRVMTDQPLSTKRSKDGTPITFNVSEDVIVNHFLVIPRGATVHGQFTRNKKPGIISGTPALTLQLTALNLGGVTYPLYTYQLHVRGATKSKPAFRQVEGGAVVGAIAGAIVRGTSDTPTTHANDAADVGGGAAVGAGAVETAAMISPKPVVKIPAESQMDLYLSSPIGIQPVSQQEANRLAQRIRGTEPVLYVRGETP